MRRVPVQQWTDEDQKKLERAMNPEGFNPPIHCGLSVGIANPQESKIPLDNAVDSAVE